MSPLAPTLDFEARDTFLLALLGLLAASREIESAAHTVSPGPPVDKASPGPADKASSPTHDTASSTPPQQQLSSPRRRPRPRRPPRPDRPRTGRDPHRGHLGRPLSAAPAKAPRDPSRREDLLR
ncbi:MAG: hypothetical protein R3B70_24560 [Polyangiaceae bacterium]